MKPYDDLEKLVSPESTKVFTEALKQLQESIKLFTDAIKEAIEDPDNPRHQEALSLLSSYHGYEIVPEVILLTQATPYTYRDVLAICENYGDGYKDIIRKHIDSGTTHEALKELREGCLSRYVEARRSIESNKHDLEKLNFQPDKKKRRKETLPRNLRNGW